MRTLPPSLSLRLCFEPPSKPRECRTTPPVASPSAAVASPCRSRGRRRPFWRSRCRQVMLAAPVHRQALPARARPDDRRRVRRSHDHHRSEADQAPDLGHGTSVSALVAMTHRPRALSLPALTPTLVRATTGRPRVVPLDHALVLPRRCWRVAGLRHYSVRATLPLSSSRCLPDYSYATDLRPPVPAVRPSTTLARGSRMPVSIPTPT